MFEPGNRGYPPDRNPPRGSFWPRLITALIIAIISFAIYMGQTEKNPITGENQRVSLSPSQEVLLGLQSFDQVAQEMGGTVPLTDPAAQEVERVGKFLLTHLKADAIPWKFQFHLLGDTQTVNALALPGGQVFITLGLYNRMENEAQLAGVLGHEMGHVIERHTAQQMAKSQLGQMLVVAVGTGAGSTGQQDGAFDPVTVASAVNQMVQLRFSRGDESQADEWGLKLMENAGYDPRAMISVMQILKAASGRSGQEAEIFQTHPNPDLRIEQIKAYLQKHPPRPGLSMGRKLPRSTFSGRRDQLEDIFRFPR